MITIEKDDFTGIKNINSKLIDLYNYKFYEDFRTMWYERLKDEDALMTNLHAFELVYEEAEVKKSTLAIRIYSICKNKKHWPLWNDEWPFLIDGERASIESHTVSDLVTSFQEIKIYELSFDILSKISNATVVRYSLRGKNDKVEGALSKNHILFFKAFEYYISGNENEGEKILKSSFT